MKRLFERLLEACRRLWSQPDARDTVLESMRYVYQLNEWPSVPARWRTAPVLRALSRMSIGPVTHDWFLARCKLQRDEGNRLIEWLVDAGSMRRIDLEAADTRPSASDASCLITELDAGREWRDQPAEDRGCRVIVL